MLIDEDIFDIASGLNSEISYCKSALDNA